MLFASTLQVNFLLWDNFQPLSISLAQYNYPCPFCADNLSVIIKVMCASSPYIMSFKEKKDSCYKQPGRFWGCLFLLACRVEMSWQEHWWEYASICVFKNFKFFWFKIKFFLVFLIILIHWYQKKIKKIYFDVFLSKKHFEKQLQPHSKTHIECTSSIVM